MSTVPEEIKEKNKSFLSVLEENYQASFNMVDEDKERPAQDMVKETYEDMIAIYKANYLEKEVPEEIELTICEYINDRKTDFTFDKLVELGKYCYGLSKKQVPDITVKEMPEVVKRLLEAVTEYMPHVNIENERQFKLYHAFHTVKRHYDQ